MNNTRDKRISSASESWMDRDQNYFVFLALIFGLRFLFLLLTGFVDDDAYHWTWTQQMDWSFFDHPGMIAWLEWLTTSIFGNNQLGIRLPSFLCYLTLSYFTFRLVSQMFGRVEAKFSLLILLFSPLWGFGGHVAAPEAPFMVLWLLGIYVFWQGMREDGEAWTAKKTWIYLGLIIGVGFNTKFPIVLLAPGFGLYLLTSPSRRRQLLTPWPYVGILISVLCLAPVLYWNLAHDWPSFKFQFRDRHQGGGFEVKRWFGFLGTQIGLMSPGVYLGLLLSFMTAGFRFREPRWRFILCLALPGFFVFYLQPFWADYKPHWMGPFYFILLFGLASLWAQGFVIGSRQWLQPRSRFFKYSIWGILIPMNVLIYAPLIYPWVPKAYRALGFRQEWTLKNDPSNELFGWPEAGKAALQWQKEIQTSTGQAPFMAGHRYEMTGQIWLATQQKTYMLSKTVSHFTVMLSAEELESLKGRDALMIANDKYPLNPLEFARFDACDSKEVPIYRHDELARIFKLYWCKNFQEILK